MSISLKIIISAALFVLTLAGGIALGIKGKPLNERLFNVHKFSALAAAMFIAMAMHNLPAAVRGADAMRALIIIAGILVVTLFVSGGLLSLQRPEKRLAPIVHRLASAAALVVLVLLSLRLANMR